MTAVICLTYDDALARHRDVVAAELTQRGLHGTFYIPAARDDLHDHLDDWRRVASMGHELGNHSCFHPCRTRPEWDWKPSYRLEEYTRERVHEELQLANRILHLIDGRTERSYGATCSDLTVANEESFVNDIKDLFIVVRSGHTEQPTTGAMSFIAPAWFVDSLKADEIIPVIDSMRFYENSWLILGMHGVGEGTHNNFIAENEHRIIVDWIASQSEWLKGVTVLEACKQLRLDKPFTILQ